MRRYWTKVWVDLGYGRDKRSGIAFANKEKTSFVEQKDCSCGMHHRKTISVAHYKECQKAKLNPFDEKYWDCPCQTTGGW